MFRKIMRIGFGALFLGVTTLSASAAPERFSGTIEQARLLGTQALDGEIFHVQGLALQPRRIWVTSIDEKRRKAYLHEFDRADGKLLRRIELTDGARYHPGGISISNGSIWVPVAELRPRSTAVLVEIDTASLKVQRKITVADHLGCVAVSGDRLVAGNWDSRLLYEFDLARNEPVRIVPNPSPTRYQDMKFSGDHLVAGGHNSLWSGTLDWIDWPSLKLTRSLRAGAVGPIRPFGRGGPFTGEGMAIEGRDVYVIPEDGPSRLFHFRLND